MNWIFFLFFIFGCGTKMEIVEKKDLVLGTFGEIICISDRESCNRAIDKAFVHIKNFEKKLSYFDKESEISLLNNSQEKEVKVSEETFYLIKKAKEISRKTDGAFDITIASLMEIWDLYRKDKDIKEPDDRLIKKILLYLGEDKIILDEKNKTVHLRNGTKIDLGGIAKGFIVDKASDILKEEGIRNFLVNIGGDIFCFGEGKDKKGWKIGIQDPEDKNKIVATLKLKNKAIATSGQYENFLEINGRKFGHIIDPRTGYPIDNDILSVSVIANDCLTADALATAVFVLGKEKVESILEEFDAQAIVITRRDKGKHFWISGKLDISY